jgi:hypothetical protein
MIILSLKASPALSLLRALLPVCLLLPTLAWGAGQALHLKHPVMDHKVQPANLATYERGGQALLAMTEEQMLRYIPPHGCRQYTECPACYGGVEGNDVLRWTPDKPEELKCRFCDTVVFPNPKYPETQTLTGKNERGEEISYPFYYDEQHKVPHYFSTHLRLHQRRWLLEQTRNLAYAWHLTGKPEYARRVAQVLDGFARAYPHYPVLRNLPRFFSFRDSQKPPWPWDSGRWNYFHNEIPIDVINIYDLVYSSPEFDKLSGERGYDVRERIERDFLKATFEAIAVKKDHINNCVGYDVRSAAILGRVLGEPRYVHWAFDWMKQNLLAGFMRDGFYPESPAYHYMTIGGLTYSFAAVKGYSDPPGYTDPVDGTRFDDLDAEKQLPFWFRCLKAPEILATPDGITAVVHDSHPYERRSKPREETFSAIAPAFGHASLGRGRGADQLMAQLHFSGGYGHQHFDNLNFMLWAKGRDLLPDVGYTWTQMRYWATSTACHNTVVIDRRQQASYTSDGNLLMWQPGNLQDPAEVGVSLVEADGKAGYREIAGVDTYRRLILLIATSPADAYVVDVFRLQGGKLHDWMLHGDADHDTTATCSLPLSGQRKWLLEEGEEWSEPVQEWHPHNPYGMIRDVAGGRTEGPLQFNFAYMGDDTRGLRVHVLPGGPTEVLLGRSPSVRRMGVGTQGDMRKAYDFWMPHLVLRRTAPADTLNTYTAVHEPWSSRPFLGHVTALPLTPADPGAVALEVRHGDFVDTIITTLDGPGGPARRTASGIALRGRVGVVRQQAGRVTGLWLYEGEELSGPGWGLKSGQARYEGEIAAVTRQEDGAAEDALLTPAPLPSGETLQGHWLIATFANGITQGYPIRTVERRGNQTAVLLAVDPGLRLAEGQATEVYHPRRTLPGPVRFHISGVATVSRQESGIYATRVTSPVQITLPR